MSEAREIRFTVKSAQEAVDRVKRELGPNGRVVSVQQVTGSGLQRFLAAPMLEIVARADAEPQPAEGQRALQSDAEATPWDSSDEAAVAVQGSDPTPAIGGAARGYTRKEEAGVAGTRGCGELLRRAGFSPVLMARLEGAEQWREICAMPVSSGLPHAVAWLRKLRQTQTAAVPRPAKLAFVGGPGVGKTTSLCKYLAREVFIHGTKPQVLQLEVDRPHMDSGLSLYCPILGLECFNDPCQLNPDSDQPLLVDIPGFSIAATAEHKSINKSLNKLGITDRVMVLNAAYDNSVVQHFLSAADHLTAHYTIWTHLDELVEFGKLWGQVLDPRRKVLFFSDGQNIAGDIIEDPFGYLLHKTFPQ